MQQACGILAGEQVKDFYKDPEQLDKYKQPAKLSMLHDILTYDYYLCAARTCKFVLTDVFFFTLTSRMA